MRSSPRTPVRLIFRGWSAPWQRVQCASRTGWTTSSKDSGPVPQGGASGGPAGRRMASGGRDGTATRADVTRVTKRLGDEIGRVYGWRFPPVREAARER